MDEIHIVLRITRFWLWKINYICFDYWNLDYEEGGIAKQEIKSLEAIDG
jgi:hypothetical protein